ncbi:MAG: recombinase family protein [Planctomycetota bacterium]|nr:recombinase family protein [Planctomycetota bacterium]
MFRLFAYEPLTLDALVERLHAEGRTFRPSKPSFPRSSVHNILRDRAYIGEIEYRGQWYPGSYCSHMSIRRPSPTSKLSIRLPAYTTVVNHS